MKDKEIKEQLTEWQREGKFLFADAAFVFNISKQHLNNMIKGHVPICGKARKRSAAGIVFMREFFTNYPEVIFIQTENESRNEHTFRKRKLLKYLKTNFLSVFKDIKF
jgi:hypothetical protein